MSIAPAILEHFPELINSQRKENALMVLPYHPEWVEEAGQHFDETVNRIQTGQFAVKTPPEAKICQECDLRMLCYAEGVIG